MFRARAIHSIRGVAIALSLVIAVPAIAVAGPRGAPTVVPTDGTTVSGHVAPGAPSRYDWFKFTGAAGGHYVVLTSQLSPQMDTVIRVWDPNLRLLGQNDDYPGGGLASRLEITAAMSGSFLIQVRHYSPHGSGTFAVSVTGPPSPSPSPSPSPPPPPPPPPPPSPSTFSVSAPLVADTKLDDGAGGSATLPIAFSAGTVGAYTAHVTILDASGALVRTVLQTNEPAGRTITTSWDGRDANGGALAPGRYLVRVDDASGSIPGSANATLNLVRLGARSVKFLDDGPSGARVQIAYHAANGQPRNYFSIDSAGAPWTLSRSTLGDGALDDAQGAPIAGPAPATDLAAPPRDANGNLIDRGRSMPIAYSAATLSHVELVLGDHASAGGAAVDCGYPVSGVPIRVSAGGAASGPIRPGATVQVEGPQIPAGLARRDLVLEIRFEYQDASGAWQPIAGEQRTRHTLYTLVGQSCLSKTGGVSADAREMPFVAAVEEVAGWAPSVTTAGDAMAEIVRGVNGKKGLTYDVVSGASAYADNGIDAPDLAFSEFLQNKSRGNIVNCSDCAALVSVYSRTVGASCESFVLGWSFDLNYIKGIGSNDWKKDIFTNGGSSFSYHAVASSNGGTSIWDACLAVDDGPNPDQVEPRIERLPIDMPFDRYRSKLTPGTFSIQSHGFPSQN